MDGPLDETVPAARALTTRDLLTFTFGFGMTMEMFTSPTPWPVVVAGEALCLSTVGPPNPDVQPEPEIWLANFAKLPLLAQPGFWTTNTDRLATAYRPTPDGLVVWDEPDGTWSHPPSFGDGAAGLVSTAEDLLAFARMLLDGGGPVLSSDSARAMTTDQLTEGQKAHGGLGPDFFEGRSWGFCQSVLGNAAFGWDGGFGCSWLVDPARQLTVIVLTQRMFETSERLRSIATSRRLRTQGWTETWWARRIPLSGAR